MIDRFFIQITHKQHGTIAARVVTGPTLAYELLTRWHANALAINTVLVSEPGSVSEYGDGDRNLRVQTIGPIFRMVYIGA